MLTYNLMLAEKGLEAVGSRQDDALSAQYRAELVPWSDEIRAEQASLSTWDLPAMWARLRAMNPRIPPGAQQFAESTGWAPPSLPRSRVMDDDTVRQLIAHREWRLKGGRRGSQPPGAGTLEWPVRRWPA